MPRKIIYLINPISGTGGKASLQELIIRRTTAQKIDFSILPTDAEGRYDFLIPILQKEQVTDIVICGGDGTVNAVAAALKGAPVRIGIIPMGSGNGLAFAARIPKDPSRALDIIFAGKASAIDGFIINGQFSCMLSGIGFDARVAHEFARQKKRGLQTYIRVSLTNFLTSRPYSFRIRLPLPPDPLKKESGGERSFPVEAFFIDVANGDQFGNHVTIAPQALLHDGLLDIVIVKKMWKLPMIFSVIRQILSGRALQGLPPHAGKKNILYFQTPELTIENPEEAPLHIDGDPKITAKEFHIKIAPGILQLIQP
jgi:YegS/Rv2252/BmrU family lipid kinase